MAAAAAATCDVDGNDVRGHGLGRLSHLLLRRGEGRSLAPHRLSVHLADLLPHGALRPPGELGLVVVRRRGHRLDDGYRRRRGSR